MKLAAPFAVKVTELPVQIAVELGAMLRVGGNTTIIPTVAELKHPDADKPFTVYVVGPTG